MTPPGSAKEPGRAADHGAPNERGFALVTVVLLMLGLAVLAAALAFAASQEAAVRASLEDIARAERAAAGAVAQATDAWRPARRSLDPIGVPVILQAELDLEPDVRIAATSRRLSGGAWLIEGRASVTRGALLPIDRSAARLVHGLDVDSVGAAFDAAIVADAIRLDAGATVEASAAAAQDSAQADAACADPEDRFDWTGAVTAFRAPAGALDVDAGATVVAETSLRLDDSVDRYRSGLGTLDREAVRAIALPIADSVLAPAPATRAAGCDTTASANWGAPDGECAEYRVLAYTDTPLRLAGGYGQGVLFVAGDLVLEGGFRFRGVIVALGTVTIGDARVDGSIAAPSVRVEDGGGVTLDRCAIAAAFLGAAPLARPLPAARSWLPTFD